MNIILKINKLYKKIELFKLNRVKDNQEKRDKLEYTNKKIIELDKFSSLLEIFKVEFKDNNDKFKLEDITQTKFCIQGIETIINDTYGIFVTMGF